MVPFIKILNLDPYLGIIIFKTKLTHGKPLCTAPFKGPRLASCVASETTEIQGHRKVWRPWHRCPRTLSRTTIANLDSVFNENSLAFIDSQIKNGGLGSF